MPLGDSRTPFLNPAGRGRSKKLGKRDTPQVDIESTLDELRTEMVALVARVLVAGGAILFGGTSDRGAVLVRLFLDGERYEDYVTSVGELVACFEAIDFVLEAQKARGPRPMR